MGENLETQAEAGAKTPEIKTDSVDVIGDFMEIYETLVRPSLVRGDVELCSPAINTLRMEFGMVEGKGVTFPHGQVYAAYRMALTYLTGLVEETQKGRKPMAGDMARRHYLDLIDRQVSFLDVAMKSFGGEKYQTYRKRFAKPLELADREAE